MLDWQIESVCRVAMLLSLTTQKCLVQFRAMNFKVPSSLERLGVFVAVLNLKKKNVGKPQYSDTLSVCCVM